uniref:Uncharacterized protein n=1 Tax=Alexandrium andersonii TaxID=327968 RepID=A0A7S2J1B7_9DINO|mmetsp:Transcript_92658/g.207464  ORF Transcript_92658/g.207464 Transcript_92658/m.207464 type:complete len:215 (+) Transcript_92658:84-728(+)
MSGFVPRFCLVALGFSGAAAVRSHPGDIAVSPPSSLSHKAALVQKEDLPACRKVAPGTFPGLCDPSVSGYACYSTEKNYTPADHPDLKVEVQWACSTGEEATVFTDEHCKALPWEYEGLAHDGSSVTFSAKNIYKGACKLMGDGAWHNGQWQSGAWENGAWEHDSHTPAPVPGWLQATAAPTPAGSSKNGANDRRGLSLVGGFMLAVSVGSTQL